MPALVFDKCCGCIELKTGCFILGYLGLIGYLIGTVDMIMALVDGAAMLQDKVHEVMHEAGLFVVVMASILLVFMLLSLFFTIVLLVGLHKNKPGHLKAYLIYSVIFLVISSVNLIYDCIISADSAVIAVIVVAILLQILLGSYFILVIRSQYYEMKNPSRGAAIYSA